MSVNLLQTPIEYLKASDRNEANCCAKSWVFTVTKICWIFIRIATSTEPVITKSMSWITIPPKYKLLAKLFTQNGRIRQRQKRLVAVFTDNTGQMELNWFQGHKWIRDSLKLNTPYVIFGKVTNFNGQYSMAHPEMELYQEHQQSLRSSMQPVYPSTETLTNRGVSNRVINKMMQQVFWKPKDCLQKPYRRIF